MADKCPICREEDCAEKRAAFAREPWLPNGFELGAKWYSYDNGMTWQRFPRPAGDNEKLTGSMTVTKIDRERGEVTVKATAHG